jgi:predicted DNA-binding ribbon-helix-helix protein
MPWNRQWPSDSIVIGGHKTSVSLEEPFWSALKQIAVQRGATLSELVKGIDVAREHSNLSSAIRLFVLAAYQNDASDPQKAGRSAHEVAA